MKRRLESFYLVVEILFVFLALMPSPSFAARTATLSVNPSSAVMTYPTYTINIIISPVTELWQVHFTLSFNDNVDFLEVPTGGVALGDLFAGKNPTLSTGKYQISGLFYLEVLIEMPGTETVASSESKSIARITFKLLDNAMPDMTSWLKLERADATFYLGSGDPPYEYIDSFSKGGITFPQQGTVTVGYLVTILTVNPASTMVEKPVALSSALKDGGGNPLVGLSVDYYVGLDKIGSAITNDFGVSSLSYTPLYVGTFTIKAEFLGSPKYASSSDTDTLNVSERSTTLSLSVQSSIKVNDTVNFVATLKKDDGTPINGETIKFYVNSTLKGSANTNTSGIAFTPYTFSSIGTYVIKAEFSGTSKYAPSSDTTTRTVAMERTSLKLTVTPQIAKVGQLITLSATLRRENNELLPNKLIYYYVNTLLVGSDATNSTGVSSITFTPSEASPPEGWKVEARYNGEPSFSSSLDTTILVVNKLATTLVLNVEPTTLTIEQSIIMTATLTAETGAVSGESVDYYIKLENRWTEIGSATTGGNGIASLDYAPTMTGTLLLKANYTGSSRYLESNEDMAIITVDKLATSLTLSMPTTAKIEQIILMSASLKDGNQKTIPNVTIDYYLLTGEQIGSAETNQEGVASLPYALMSVGSFQIKATYSGSIKYLESSDSEALTVNPLETTLTFTTLTTTRVGDTVALVTTLKDENQKAVQGLAIEYSILIVSAWNTIGTATTNQSGVATLEYTPSQAGTYRLIAKFSPKLLAMYAESTSSEVTLTVRKVQTTLIISLSNTSIPVQTSTIISATLKDEDAQPISRASIYLEIFKNGEWTSRGSALTNLQGVAPLNFQPSTDEARKTLRLRAVYAGDSQYAESTSQEANLEVTEGTESAGSFDPFSFLGDDQLTVLDFLFWGVIMLAFITLVGVSIRRKIKSSQRQTTTA